MNDALLAFFTALSTGIVLPLPEEAVLLGLAASHPESAGLVSLGVGAFLGLALRDLLLFLLGRQVGRRAFQMPLLKRFFGGGPVAGIRADAGQAARAVLAARFAFGVKAGAQVTLGVVGVPLLTYVLVNVVVLALYVTVWVSAGAWFREPAEQLLAWMGENRLLLLAMAGIVALAWATRRFSAEEPQEDEDFASV